MVSINIWSGTTVGPTNGLVEMAHDLKLRRATGYRLHDQSLLIELLFNKKDEKVFRERLSEFEQRLAKMGFHKVPEDRGGKLKAMHYTKSES